MGVTRRTAFNVCSSCGRAMDRAVYFTMCPHCGFNYRIEVLPVEEKVRLTLSSLLPPFFVIAAVVCAALVIILLT